MKKNLKKLVLNKSTLTNLEQDQVNGGIRVFSIGVNCSNQNSCNHRPGIECSKGDTKSWIICKTLEW